MFFITEFVVFLLLNSAFVQTVVVALKQEYTSNRHGNTTVSKHFSKWHFFEVHFSLNNIVNGKFQNWTLF